MCCRTKLLFWQQGGLPATGHPWNSRQCSNALAPAHLLGSDLTGQMAAGILFHPLILCYNIAWPQEHYGDGYMLTVTAAVDQPVDANAISSMITQHVVSATLERACGGELVYRLPNAPATSAALPELLDALDSEGVLC
jgi:hypothetical protein